MVERSRIDVRWALTLLGALVDSSNTASTAPSALKIESIGNLALRDVTLVAGSRTLLANLDSSLTGGDRFVVSRLHGRSEGSELQASGELSSVAKRIGTFTVDAPSLDLDGLMAFLAAATPAGARQTPSPEAATAPPAAGVPLHLDIAVRGRQGRALGIAFTNLETTGRMSGGAVSLEALKMEAFGGRFAGSAGFDGSQREPRYDWRGRFDNLDVPALVAFAGSPGSMTGRLAGTVALAAAGVEPLEAIKRARGTARVTVTDGRVPGLDIVRTRRARVWQAVGRTSRRARAKRSRAWRRRLRWADRRLSTSDSDVRVARSRHDGGGDAVAGHAGGQPSHRRDAVARVERAGGTRSLPARARGRTDCPARANRRHRGVTHGLRRRPGRPEARDSQSSRGRSEVISRSLGKRIKR